MSISVGRDGLQLVLAGSLSNSELTMQEANWQPQMTFQAFVKLHYVDWIVATKRSPETDISKLQTHLYACFGNLDIASINRQSVDRYLINLAKTHRPATVNRHLALLSSIFKLAVNYGFVGTNPCKGIKKRIENNVRHIQLSVAEIARLRSVMADDPNQTAMQALLFLLFTGARREEALQARWGAIDLERKVWFIPENKSGNGRHVILNDAALEVLCAMPHDSDTSFVFPGKIPGKPIRNITKAFERVLKAAGLNHIRIHDLRHVFASLLVSQGASLYQVQQLLGHSSPSTTQRYAHLSCDSLRETSQAITKILTNNFEAHRAKEVAS